jgi:hypothetical protein
MSTPESFGYIPLPSGVFMKMSDGTGPYIQTANGTFALAATGSGSGGGGGAVTIANGADVSQGAIADAAVTNPAASASVIAALKGVLSLLAGADPQLPAALGPQTAANSLSIVNAVSTTPTNASGTITTGNTAQNAAAANANRRGFALQNHSTGDLWFSTISTAVISQPSFKLPPGAYYESPPFGGGVGAISIIGATTGQAFTGREW